MKGIKHRILLAYLKNFLFHERAFAVSVEIFVGIYREKAVKLYAQALFSALVFLPVFFRNR